MNSLPLVIVVEDEFFIAEHIVSILEKKGFRVLSFFSADFDFEKIAQKDKPYLVFLGIHLEDETSGLDIAKSCQSLDIPFIYLTSNSDEKTVEAALRFEPLAYMLKPFTTHDIEVNLALAMTKIKNSNKPSALIVKDGYDTLRIGLSEIKWLKSDNNYTEIVTASNRFVERNTLQAIYETLPSDEFIQVHRSYVVNVNEISRVSGDYLEINGSRIPMSRKRKSEILERIKY